MSSQHPSPFEQRSDVTTESRPGLRACGTFVFLLVLAGLGVGLFFAAGKTGSIEKLAERLLPWIESAQEATGDTFERTPLEAEQEDAPRSAVLDSGQTIVGDFEILSIEGIWASGDVEGAMSVAIEKNPQWLRRLLEDEGVDPNLRLTHGRGDGWAHPLEKAVRQGTRETFEILLEEGADPNGQSSSGSGALHEAARKGYLDIAKELINHGADPELLAVGQMDDLLAERMQEMGQSYEPGIGSAVIEGAAWNGRTEMVAYLLAEGVELRYALHAAAHNGSVELIELLLDHGADPRVTTTYGDGPLNGAAGQGHLEVVELLLTAGARPGVQALRTTAQHGSDDIIRAFAAAGVSFAVPPTYWDALYAAAYSGHLSTVQLLLELGASPHAGEDLESPIDAARKEGHEEIVALLAAAGAE